MSYLSLFLFLFSYSFFYLCIFSSYNLSFYFVFSVFFLFDLLMYPLIFFFFHSIFLYLFSFQSIIITSTSFPPSSLPLFFLSRTWYLSGHIDVIYTEDNMDPKFVDMSVLAEEAIEDLRVSTTCSFVIIFILSH